VAPKVKKINQQIIINGFASRCWHQDRRGKFYYRDPKTDELIEFTEVLLAKYLAGENFYGSILECAAKEKGRELTKEETKKLRGLSWLRFLHHVIKHNRVDWAGELAGYQRGEHTVNGAKIVISKGYKLIEPVKGNPSFILNFLKDFLPNNQYLYALTWLLDRYEGLLHPEKYTPGQALLIGGEAGDGKTLFKRRIVRPLLGGRGVDAISYLIGDDNWNDDLAKAELWEVDDQGDTHNYDRYGYTNNLKKAVADPDLRIRTRYLSATTLPLKTAIIVLFNTEARNYALLPEDTGDIRDKLIVLKSAKASLPESSAEIESQIEQALPAFIYWLLHEFQVPLEIRTEGRFRIVPYKDPGILEAIQDTSPATHLSELLQQFVEELPTPRWKDLASRIYNTLLCDASWRVRLEKICRSFSRFVQLMTELSRRKGSGVTYKRTRGKRFYEIQRLGVPKQPKGPNVVAMAEPKTRKGDQKTTEPK
jgi:hypothetical protein